MSPGTQKIQETGSPKILKNQEVQVLDDGSDCSAGMFVQRRNTPGGLLPRRPWRGSFKHRNWATVLPQNSSAVGSVPHGIPFTQPRSECGAFPLRPCLSGFPR